MSGLAESYLAALRQPVEKTAALPVSELDAVLGRLYDLGREDRPGISIEGRRFAAHLALCGAPVDDSIDAPRAADLYLACAALEADPAAISALERQCWPVVLRYLRPLRRSKAIVDDLRQELWDSLLVTRPGTPAKLVTYSGRGPLAHFVGITAQRLALMQFRRDDARARVADRAAREMSGMAADAELVFVKSRYRGAFREALSGALEVLDDRSRLILRMHLVDGLTFDRIARAYNVSQSTISRWMADVRSSVVNEARARLGERLGVSETDFDSLWKLVASQLDLSVSRLLH
jgi:RNA polymerase sigma-70 factor (ECF subfamily)